MKSEPVAPIAGQRPTPPSAVESLHVLTVNTHKGFTLFNRRFILPELREAVRTVSADLVFLQEVLGTHVRHARRHANWPDTPQYEFLADAMWSDFAYGCNAVYPHGDHGNAVLSKYPILEHRNFDISVPGPERRGMLYCRLDVPGHWQVHAICVHLGLRERDRQKQLGLLGELVCSLPAEAQVIVAGDFNDWRQRASGRLEPFGLHEAFALDHGELARSFPARFPLLRLDRIYVRNAHTRDARLLSHRPWSHLSDHLPLAAQVHL